MKKHDKNLLKRAKLDPIPLLEEIAKREDADWYYEQITKECGWQLEFIPVTGQSKKVCWNALRSYPSSIRWVQNQTFWMCIYTLFKYPSSIKWIRNQTPLVCLFALWKSPLTAMQHITTQTNLVCRYAIHQSWFNYRDIKNPTYPMALQAVKKCPRVIKDINPIFHSEEICELVVKNQPSLVGELFHPPFELYIQAVQATPMALVSIDDMDVLRDVVLKMGLTYLDIRKQLECFRNPLNREKIDDTMRRIKFILKER